jgi:hypothetical protein
MGIGTVLLYQDSSNDTDPDTNEQHHHEPELIKTKDGIVLSPQPHEDPNDPLVLTQFPRSTLLTVELAGMET